MKILYIADGRSPITSSWIGHFIDAGHEVHLVSSYACPTLPSLASFVIIPIGIGSVATQAQPGRRSFARSLRQYFPVTLRTHFLEWLAPLSFAKAADTLSQVIEQIKPDIIHALRIPYEGMVASLALKSLANKNKKYRTIPLLTSVWGNDFTLHAKATPFMSYYTRQTLLLTDGLHTDCQRDQRLAVEWGFNPKKEKIILLAGGGIRIDTFYPIKQNHVVFSDKADAGKKQVTIINPRGIRAYVCNDTFFRAIPIVLNRFPEVRFICPGMIGEFEAQKWVDRLGISEWVDLLPAQSRKGMAELFRRAQITVSITTHDGTPNTLLEAMACGCFPIVGDLESLREWITPGENGLLVKPKDPNALANAIIEALSNPELMASARKRNIQLVNEHAEYDRVMETAEEFYQLLVSNKAQNIVD